MNFEADPRLVATRRCVLTAGTVSLAAASLSACDALSTDPAGGGGDGSGGTDAKQAPDLAELVEQGELAPLTERLPAQPMVLEPLEEVGSYGGELTVVLLRGQEERLVNHTIAYEQLLRWKPGARKLTADEVVPNVAESFEIDAEGAEYTFTLREGMKWSDGEAFTADDIVFWYEDVLGNPELTPQMPTWLVPGNAELTVEKVDDHTVVFRFSEPHGLFALSAASQQGNVMTRYPAHYLRQFHPAYNDNVEKAADDAGLDNWMDLFFRKADFLDNPELPVLNAWMLTSGIGAGGQRIIAERNPFYWKTDTDDNQLPYIDRVIFDVAENDEAAILKVTNGEIDMVARDINHLTDKPVFAQHRRDGDYDFFETIPQQMNQMLVHVNLTHQNPALRELFGNKNFRIGLSHAINRQEIIDTVYAQQGKPWQAAPRPESPYYNEHLATQFTEYDPDLANDYLDKVAPERNSDGMRLRPDGKPISFQVEASTNWPDMIDAMELIRDYWRHVGVAVATNTVERSLFATRIEANEHDAAVDLGHNGLVIALEPTDYVPTNLNSRYAIPWVYWYQDANDERAEEPPAETRKQIEMFRQLQSTLDQAEQDKLMNDILDIAADQFYTMGIALRSREYGIISNKLRNTPQLSIAGYHHADLMPTNPQQYFFADE